jgi:hypothetical protein
MRSDAAQPNVVGRVASELIPAAFVSSAHAQAIEFNVYFLFDDPTIFGAVREVDCLR